MSIFLHPTRALGLLLITLSSAPALAQATPPISSAQARLEVCLGTARTDPASAISQASQWLAEEAAPYTSRPRQCLGTAYMSLLRWEAAEEAFIAARDDRPSGQHAARANLGAMAGNAALAAENYEDALTALDIAQGDAETAMRNQISGEIAADRARALVGLGREQEARNSLSYARGKAPQVAVIWLLSATLERRLKEYDAAQRFITTARALGPSRTENNSATKSNLDTGILSEITLEAGLIAALAGRFEAAEKSWQSLLNSFPNSPSADQARKYLAHLEEISTEEDTQEEGPAGS